MVEPLRVGVFGLGLIGQQVVQLFRDRKPEGLQLVAVTSRDLAAAAQRMKDLGVDVLVLPVEEMVACVDVVAEAATALALREIAEPVLRANKTLVCVSAAGIITCEDLLPQIGEPGSGRVILASGALPGVDIMRAACELGVSFCSLENRVPPVMLVHSPFVKELGFDLTKPLKEPLVVFQGTAREVAHRFPRHLNVAMTMMYAMRHETDFTVTLVADPALTESVSRIRIENEAGRFSFDTSNRLTAENRAARIVAPSILAAMRRLVDPVLAGS